MKYICTDVCKNCKKKKKTFNVLFKTYKEYKLKN